MRSVPYMGGHVWVGVGRSWEGGTDGGFHVSTDFGRTFTALPDITHVREFGFGAPAPGRDNPTVFFFGDLNGTIGMYRSIDMGRSWDILTDERNMLGNITGFVQGCRRQFGVVFAGSDGRGIYMGHPRGLELNPRVAEVPVFDGNTRVFHNGEQISFINQPAMINDILMVPVREFLGFFDANLEWNPYDKSLTVWRRELDVRFNNVSAAGVVTERRVEIFLDNTAMMVNGIAQSMSLAPYIVNNTLYAPVDALAFAMGASTESNIEVLRWYVEDHALVMYD